MTGVYLGRNQAMPTTAVVYPKSIRGALVKGLSWIGSVQMKQTEGQW